MAKKSGSQKSEPKPVIINEETKDQTVETNETVQDQPDETPAQETPKANGSGRAVVPATSAYNLTQEVIDNAIEAGWIVANPEPVDLTIRADSSPTKKDEVLPYMQLLGITWEGFVLLSGGKAEPAVKRGPEKVDTRTEAEAAKGAPDHFNYGLDLEVKRQLRRKLEQEITGPAKVIERMAKMWLEQGAFDTLDEAREHVKDVRRRKGLPV